MTLTIAIPTYNRNETLLENVRYLLPQLTAECRLVILDNCSDVPVEETLASVLCDFPDANIEIRRNKVNIGGSANWMRCFELCDSEWLWILSDDDTARPDAINIIFEHVALYPTSTFFNFASELFLRDRMIVTSGMEEFVENIDHFWNIIFISAGVYRRSAVVSNLKLGYTYAYSQVPQFVLLLTSLGDEGVCCLSQARIVQWNPPASGQEWSWVNIGLGLMTFLDLAMKPRIREKLAAKLLEATPVMRHYVIQLLLMSRMLNDHRTALYIYDQLCYRLYYFDTRISRRIMTRFYRLILMFPQISYTAIDIYKSFKGSSMSDHVLLDRFRRI